MTQILFTAGLSVLLSMIFRMGNYTQLVSVNFFPTNLGLDIVLKLIKEKKEKKENKLTFLLKTVSRDTGR